MLTGPTVHIETLVLLTPLTIMETARYLTHLTTEWAVLWGVTLTVEAVAVGTAGKIDVKAEVEAFDALMSTAAEGGTDVAPADALAPFLLPCGTPPDDPAKAADGFCVAPTCAGCAGVGRALLQFVEVPNKRRPWYITTAQPTITRWRNA